LRFQWQTLSHQLRTWLGQAWKPLAPYLPAPVALAVFVSALLGTWIWSLVSLHHLKTEVRSLRESNQQLEQRFQTLQTQLSKGEKERSFESPPKLTIQRPSRAGMILENRLDIKGEAPGDYIIALSINGKLRAVTLPKAERFSFSGITLKRGQNELVVKALGEDGSVVALERIRLFYSPPTPSYLARPFLRGNLSQPLLALTFDGGSIANATPEILDILRAYRIRCTMFLTGQFIQKFPDIVRRIVAEGHEVANHTFSHPHLTTYETNHQHDTLPHVTREFVQLELKKTEELFKKTTGRPMAPFWRPPYGEHNAEIRQWAAEIGYRMVGWTVGRGWEETLDTMDWVADSSSPSYRTAEEIRDKIFRAADAKPHGLNGAIILMHLGTLRHNDFPHKKLPEIIEGLKQRGYQLVTISELMP